MILNDLFPILGFLTLATPSFAIPHNTGPKDHDGSCFVKFNDFIAGVTDATYDKWAHTTVQNATAFEEIKSHILTMYHGIGEVTHSFIYDDEYGDCVDVKKQPGLRLQGIDHIAPAPIDTCSEENAKTADGPQTQFVESPLKLDLKDSFGNVIYCRDLTIPFPRLTLEKLTSFRTLADFFSKGNDTEPALTIDNGGDGGSSRRQLVARGAAQPHLYAVASQTVKNFGGNSWLSLWNPVGDFSLSQQWYVGGSGANLQTVEGGWVVYPGKFKTKNAVLFIFYTADNYKTKKCWNLDCAAFVQTNKNWFLGRGFTHYSAFGGGQWGFEMQWKLVGGNWWLYLKGPGAYEAVGYYPTKIFGSGQLSKSAEVVEYGGEVTRDSADHRWPQMGSSIFPSYGFGQSAFQRTIYYTARDEPGGVGVWTNLQKLVIGSNKCWDINITQAAQGGSWGTYFFFGGPGGQTCN
ncbi:uncharacterized protein LACBIDRAFT_303459 [Laccaria bicolor S238N-H82]|uniref:Predicted protein n=1 Tax=Laccaria bicolor (strain S238N-H82 / ATCC MYA-4686) TaxID=486041 RepID=B0DJI6_LACBS|nr:uncharacterized protein LACBIDRAFT_303459 [Laccaria bicolor S238N-H82]EDR05125.1 predicted protein [Laccaria bicolor S238N-H82]|eukprot:XP_001884090.1 predicted protein [Laccaria bicolor S238N-H82]